jgi:hypothetical protein
VVLFTNLSACLAALTVLIIHKFSEAIQTVSEIDEALMVSELLKELKGLAMKSDRQI